MWPPKRRARTCIAMLSVLLMAALVLDWIGPRFIFRHIVAYSGPGDLVSDISLPKGQRIDLVTIQAGHSPIGVGKTSDLKYVPNLDGRIAIAIPMDVSDKVDLGNVNFSVMISKPSDFDRGESKFVVYVSGVVNAPGWEQLIREDLQEIWYVAPSHGPLTTGQLQAGRSYTIRINISGRAVANPGSPSLDTPYMFPIRLVLW